MPLVGSMKTSFNVKPHKYRFKKKYISKSVYVVPPLVVLYKNISTGAPIFFSVGCTQNPIHLKTTDLKYHNNGFKNKDFAAISL